MSGVFPPQTHLIFMLLELFKNSARAVIEHGGGAAGGANASAPPGQPNLPPVTVSVFQTETDVVQIKVKDTGGGIPLNMTDSIFEYGFTTLEGMKPASSEDEALKLVSGVSARPIAGEGFGLPMTRQYAKFFEGDLTVQSTLGYGTEVHLRLREPRGPAFVTVE